MQYRSYPWLIYALGGGWGHLVRALALGRIAAARRPVIIVCNSPYAADLLLYAAGDEESLPIVEGCYIHAIPASATSAQTYRQAVEILTAESYECLIVDTFPRGLGGELFQFLSGIQISPSQLPAKILVNRDINPDYVESQGLQEFVAANFDLVLGPDFTSFQSVGGMEVSSPSTSPGVQHTKPWLIRSPSELGGRVAAMSRLKLDPNQNSKVVLVCAAGNAEELSLYGQVTIGLDAALPDVVVRCLAPEKPPTVPPHLWQFHWPAMECFPAADVVVGAGGYNTVYECLAVGVPLVAFALPRKYDRQKMRLIHATSTPSSMEAIGEEGQWPPVKLVETPAAAINAVQEFLQVLRNRGSLDASRDKPSSFKETGFLRDANGAIEAVKLIEALLEEKF
ncbi:MAG TPA: UDP-N-acetylglucosamine--LPS N-acetylglucosamine transferase [Oscillatoriaceae cyanobacterium M33_DOE_052]|uniref:UDP-N-acetylglucosamine--LPS N-acetylglucosamine transferase n=1 Tax=Planktothricoides sp. SpSt-374 TaxID=2282167 RepID=A0A7C3VSZ1_9CYAN|nr:UDP-N-acetylglucosamine--LPS N-acetylglucosamine transferase [Oscillatoriaceae cyanobacterium M33_DOE_052]